MTVSEDVRTDSNIPIFDTKQMSKDLALSFVPILHAGYKAHDECRKDASEQLNAELERAKAAGEGYNALYVSSKELELATHSSAMLQAVAALAILAALGVPVPVPMGELQGTEDTTQ